MDGLQPARRDWDISRTVFAILKKKKKKKKKRNKTPERSAAETAGERLASGLGLRGLIFILGEEFCKRESCQKGRAVRSTASLPLSPEVLSFSFPSSPLMYGSDWGQHMSKKKLLRMPLVKSKKWVICGSAKENFDPKKLRHQPLVKNRWHIIPAPGCRKTSVKSLIPVSVPYPCERSTDFQCVVYEVVRGTSDSTRHQLSDQSPTRNFVPFSPLRGNAQCFLVRARLVRGSLEFCRAGNVSDKTEGGGRERQVRDVIRR